MADLEKSAPEELAYLAGILDGEGYLSISCHTKNDGFLFLRPHLMIVNTNKPIIDFCQGRLGGYVGSRIREGCQPSYSLQSSGLIDVKRWLEATVPYLIAKQEVASLLIHWISLRQARKRWRGFSPDQIDLANKIRDLTKRNGHTHRRIDWEECQIQLRPGQTYTALRNRKRMGVK